jgi:formylglycine-generating enzyme required for sulfatase activity
MGTPETEPQREAQERLHQVTLTHSFYIGVREVTQRQWAQVMTANPSHFSDCPECPVERVNLFDVQGTAGRIAGSVSGSASPMTRSEAAIVKFPGTI